MAQKLAYRNMRSVILPGQDMSLSTILFIGIMNIITDLAQERVVISDRRDTKLWTDPALSASIEGRSTADPANRIVNDQQSNGRRNVSWITEETRCIEKQPFQNKFACSFDSIYMAMSFEELLKMAG